jgi:hypothetical protein
MRIGGLAKQLGIATSKMRFLESRGLVHSTLIWLRVDWPLRSCGRRQIAILARLTRAREPSHSVISYEVLAQALDSETGIAGLDLKKELGSD